MTKAPVTTVPTPTTGQIVISSLLPNPVGDDQQLETVTLRNKGTARVSLAGWTLERLGHARLLGGQLGRTRPANGSRHVRIRSQADPEVDPLCVSVTLWLT